MSSFLLASIKARVEFYTQYDDKHPYCIWRENDEWNLSELLKDKPFECIKGCIKGQSDYVKVIILNMEEIIEKYIRK